MPTTDNKAQAEFVEHTSAAQKIVDDAGGTEKLSAEQLVEVNELLTKAEEAQAASDVHEKLANNARVLDTLKDHQEEVDPSQNKNAAETLRENGLNHEEQLGTFLKERADGNENAKLNMTIRLAGTAAYLEALRQGASKQDAKEAFAERLAQVTGDREYLTFATTDANHGQTLVPTIYDSRIVNQLLSYESPITAGCDVLYTDHMRTIEFNSVAADGTLATASEAETAVSLDVNEYNYSHITSNVYLYGAKTTVTERQLRSAEVEMTDILTRDLAHRTGRTVSNIITNGDGTTGATGQPKGLWHGVTASQRVNNGHATDLQFRADGGKGLMGLRFAPNRYEGGSSLRYACHQSVIGEIYGLSETTNRPIFEVWTPRAADASPIAMSYTLMGLPLYPLAYAPNATASFVSNGTPLMLGDLNAFQVRFVSNIGITASSPAENDGGEITLRTRVYVGSYFLDTTAFKWLYMAT